MRTISSTIQNVQVLHWEKNAVQAIMSGRTTQVMTVQFTTLKWSSERLEMDGTKNILVHILSGTMRFSIVSKPVFVEAWVLHSVILRITIFTIFIKKNQFTGAELAGIKIHAAIDTKVEKNRIHDVGAFGCWFDWMAQGTRISKNLLYRNDWQDLFFEVNHGPFLVDNNILLSAQGIATQSEGGAFVHNLIAGQMTIWSDPNRFTPYHLPHSTEVAGLATVLAGDDRYYNNIFIGGGKLVKSEDTAKYGLSVFDIGLQLPAMESRKPTVAEKLPVWINNNVYCNGALPYNRETDFLKNTNFNPEVKIIEEKNNVYLQFSVNDSLFNYKTRLVTSELLGKTKMSKEGYENPDGSPLQIDTDFFDNKRATAKPSAGPFENLGNRYS